ncbi:hypothetical protein TWF694_006656 [Orbilia ellipsospora]|uniref:F-box domain-containing protein n=1 Tax=Orbilia ellipsospora TaxID=2528407 RepID=A0AAV9XL57_9PEZI
MPTLLSLPPEILIQICNEIPHLDHGPWVYKWMACVPGFIITLTRLVKTCRLLRQVAEPILYRDTFTGGEYWPLFRTLLTRKDLASHVKSFTMGEFDYEEKMEPSQEEREAVKGLIRQLSHNADGSIRSSAPEWLMNDPFQHDTEDYECSSEDPIDAFFLALSLLILPKLESLCFISSWCIEENTFLPNSLQSLTELSFSHSDTEGSMGLDEINAFLRAAPNLRVLRGHMVGDASDVSRHEGIREVHLTYSGLEAKGLIDLMNSFPFLEVFTYESGGAIVTESYDEAVPREFTDALLCRKNTLRHVVIDLSNSCEISDGLLARDTLQSLQAMEVLEILAVDSPTICPTRRESIPEGDLIINILPRSIKSFSIRGPNPLIHNDILQLAEVAKTRFPNLNHVDFSGYDNLKLNEAFVFNE